MSSTILAQRLPERPPETSCQNSPSSYIPRMRADVTPEDLRWKLETPWVEQLRLGATDAFSRVYQTMHAPLQRFALIFVQSNAVAEEIVQDTFAQCWEHRSDFRDPRSLETWLYTATKNRCLNWLRQERTRARLHASADPAMPPAMSTHAPSTSELVETIELRDRVVRAIAKLPQHQQAIVACRWGEGLSYDAIAARLGISVKSVRWNLERAAAALRPSLRGLR